MDAVRSQDRREWPANPSNPDAAAHAGASLDGFSLPGWIYHDDEFLAAERERACCEFGLDLPASTASHHFKVLVEAGVIDRRRDGTRLLTFVRRADLDRAFPGLLDLVLSTPAEIGG